MTIAGAHIAMELWGAVFCLIALTSLGFERSLWSKGETWLVMLLTANMLLLLSDTIAWSFRGAPGQGALSLVRLSNFSVFALYQVITVLFVMYLRSFDAERPRWRVHLEQTIFGLCAITLVFLVVNQFTGTFYDFDAQNRYYRTELFPLYQAPGVLSILLLFALVLSLREKISKTELFSLFTYAAFPAVGFSVSVFVYGVSFLNIGITASIFVMFAVHLAESARRHVERERSLSNARMSILVSQIGPHFLYNTLSTISTLCTRDPQLASTATDRFAGYMRANLDGIGRTEPISFQKVLDHVTTYLWLEQLRFGPELSITFNIKARDFQIPALTIQPIVENAIKHGFMGREGLFNLDLTTDETDEYWRVIVTDDGVGFDPSKPVEDGARSHIGIDNVRMRLNAMMGALLEVDSIPHVRTRVTILIPKEGASS